MRITKITIRVEHRSPNSQIRGYAAIIFDDCFRVDHIRIVQTAQGSLVAIMPNRRIEGVSRRGDCATLYDKEGQPYHFRDMAHPVRPEFQRYLTSMILEAYQDTVRRRNNERVYDAPALSRITAEAV